MLFRSQPNAGDKANAVLSGTITAVGPTAPFAFRGPMNLVIWASLVTTLTTTAASLNYSVASAVGLAAVELGTLHGADVTLVRLACCGAQGEQAVRDQEQPFTLGVCGLHLGRARDRCDRAITSSR